MKIRLRAWLYLFYDSQSGGKLYWFYTYSYSHFHLLFKEIFIFKHFFVIFIKKIHFSKNILSLIVRSEVKFCDRENRTSEVNEQRNHPIVDQCFGQHCWWANIGVSSFYDQYRNILKEKDLDQPLWVLL